MAFFFSPVLNEQQFDANGDPLAGGQIETYLAGTTTPVTTYKTESGTAHSNPIILDSSGYYPTGTQLWLAGGAQYKFIVKSSVVTGSVVIRTIDYVTGINDTNFSPSEWVPYTISTFSYLSANSFSVVGDQTNIFEVGRRVQTMNTGGVAYGTVLTAVYSSPNTTVTLTNTSGTLDVGLSAVYYAILSATNPSVPVIRVTNFTMATDRVLGRATSGVGQIEELTYSQVGTRLSASDAQAQAGVATDVLLNPANLKSAQIQLGTAVTLTNQTAVDFTSIPAWAKRVTLLFSGLSTNSSSVPILRMGHAGGIETAGYVQGASTLTNAVISSNSASNEGFYLLGSAPTAATILNGKVTLERFTATAWIATVITGLSNAAGTTILGGAKNLANTLTQVRLTTVNGTDQFDAGNVNISWE